MPYPKTRVAYGSVAVRPSSSSYIFGAENCQAFESVAIRPSSSSYIFGPDNCQAFGSVNVTSIEGFLMLVDAIDADLSSDSLASAAHVEINARLKINDVVVPITSFGYQVPTGRLGSLLNVRLATKDATVVPNGAVIDFDLIVKVGVTDVVYPLMTDGKLQGRSVEISFRGGNNAGPTDEITFSSLDVIADKFSLTPRRPVIQYDPIRVKYDDVNTRDVKNAMREESGALILPVLEPVRGLKMKQILKRAYTQAGGQGMMSPVGRSFSSSNTRWVSRGLLATGATNYRGMDFAQVITNIPDYPVKRADYTIEGGWHEGARACIEMFAPVYFVHSNILFIIDVDRKLPFASTVYELSLGAHKRLVENADYQPDKNSVILTYQYSGNDNDDPQKIYREVFTSETETIGERNAEGYIKTETRRWDREYYMADDPDNVLDTLPIRSETTTRQTIWWYIADTLNADIIEPKKIQEDRIVHRETIEYTYEGELKVGHNREVEAHILVPVNEFNNTAQVFEDRLRSMLLRVEVERCTIEWTDDPMRHGQKIQQWMTQETTGICYISDEAEEFYYGEGESKLLVRRLYPAVELNESGRVTPDMQITSDLQRISTVKETLHRLRGNNFDVERIESNHLNNTVKKTFVDTRVGTTNSDPYETRSRNVILRDEDSEALIGTRIPLGVNAYELPRAMALELGAKVLRRLQNPPLLLPLDLPGVDFAIARGTPIKGQKRSGSTVNFMVTGYSINGENLGRDGHRIRQSIEALQLLADG